MHGGLAQIVAFPSSFPHQGCFSLHHADPVGPHARAGKSASAERASPHQFSSFTLLIAACVSFHNPCILRLALGLGNTKTVYIHLTRTLIEKLKEQLQQCLSPKDGP